MARHCQDLPDDAQKTVRPEEPAPETVGACSEPSSAGVSKGRQTTSVLSVLTWRGFKGAPSRTSAAQAPKVLHSSFDEGFLLGTSPALHSSFHLERLDSGLEFLVPNEPALSLTKGDTGRWRRV